jgi:hypothetical protein
MPPREPIEDMALGTFSVVIVLFVLVTILCTPAGRLVRRLHPHAEYDFYLDVV